jgi:hypothetical protein
VMNFAKIKVSDSMESYEYFICMKRVFLTVLEKCNSERAHCFGVLVLHMHVQVLLQVLFVGAGRQPSVQ